MIALNYRDARPIYEQVRDGLRHLVVTGAIGQGEKLPSVRALAASLAINPNTIQRAYAALEEEGYLSTLPGKGAFAAAGGPEDGERQARLLEQFDAAARELLFLGMTPQELAERVEQAGGNHRDGGPGGGACQWQAVPHDRGGSRDPRPTAETARPTDDLTGTQPTGEEEEI